MNRKKYRSKLEVLNDVFETCLTGKNARKICIVTRLGYKDFKKIYNLVEERNLLEVYTGGRNVEYRTTEAGKEYMSTMDDVKKVIGEMDADPKYRKEMSIERIRRMLDACQQDGSASSLMRKSKIGSPYFYNVLDKLSDIGLIDVTILKDCGNRKSRKIKTTPEGVSLLMLTNKLYDLVGENFK